MNANPIKIFVAPISVFDLSNAARYAKAKKDYEDVKRMQDIRRMEYVVETSNQN